MKDNILHENCENSFKYRFAYTVMYWNEIMSHKARTLVAKLRRQSRVRPYRERAEITPLLSAQNGQKQNGNSSVINISNNLYPILEVYEGEIKIKNCSMIS